jgi:hypothetical protein
VTGGPPKGAGSGETSPTTERGARWPASTTRSMLPVGSCDSPEARDFWSKLYNLLIIGTGGAPGGPQHGPNEPSVRAKKVGAPGVSRLKLGSGF